LGRLVPLPLAAERHYAYQQQVTAAVVRAAQLAWARVSLADLDGSWAAVAGGLLTLVTAAQVAAARDADPYLAAVLAEMGHPDDPAGQVQPAAFAGVASDGRGLGSLLDEALVTVKVGLKARTAPERALASGGSQLEMLAQTTVQDTGRAAVSAGMIARPHVKGYVRILVPPSCSRCVILAGRVYRYSTGFQRHPRCNCAMAPATDLGDAEEQTVDPMAAVRAGQVRGLSKAEEAAISDGADLEPDRERAPLRRLPGHDHRRGRHETWRRGEAAAGPSAAHGGRHPAPRVRPRGGRALMIAHGYILR
jgi:hypothetical protein